MPCPPLTYENVSPEAWERIKAAVVAEMPSMAPMADAGTGQAEGCAITWVYTGGTLTLTVIDSPFFLPCSTINSQVDGLIQPLLA